MGIRVSQDIQFGIRWDIPYLWIKSIKYGNSNFRPRQISLLSAGRP